MAPIMMPLYMYINQPNNLNIQKHKISTRRLAHVYMDIEIQMSLRETFEMLLRYEFTNA